MYTVLQMYRIYKNHLWNQIQHLQIYLRNKIDDNWIWISSRKYSQKNLERPSIPTASLFFRCRANDKNGFFCVCPLFKPFHVSFCLCHLSSISIYFSTGNFAVIQNQLHCKHITLEDFMHTTFCVLYVEKGDAKCFLRWRFSIFNNIFLCHVCCIEV